MAITIKPDERTTGAAQDPAAPVDGESHAQNANSRRVEVLLRIARARPASNPADNCLRAFVQSIERQVQAAQNGS